MTTGPPPRRADLAGHPSRHPLPSAARPTAVVAGLATAERPAVLWGDWFGGGVLVFARPLRTVPVTDAADAAAFLDALPRAPDLPGGVGGGWLAVLGYQPGTSSLACYDSVLRWQPAAGWTFETLGLPGREAETVRAEQDWRRRLAAAEDPLAPDATVGPFRTAEDPGVARDHHLAMVEDAAGRIHRGELYQVNLCTRLHAELTGSPAALFARLAAALQPARGALLPGPTPDRALVSLSPELFLQVRGETVTTAPIKGTAPRAPGSAGRPAGLLASAKDAAENVMITDLMRNDLSRVCRPGTVTVTELLGVQPHPGVWHLVSTVTGELAADAGYGRLVTETFPPGSVTGAPKSAAVRALAALEAEPRGAYTGAAGLVSPVAGADLSVLIRTFETTELSASRHAPACSAADDSEAEVRSDVQLGVGGGITVDSVPVREWQECLDKAAPLVAAAGSSLAAGLRVPTAEPEPGLVQAGVFESVLVVDGRPLRLAGHLARLDRSCRELYHAGPPLGLAAEVTALAQARPAGRHAVRVQARPGSGGLEVEVTARPLGPRLAACRLAYADRPARSWRHKWADRTALADAEQAVAAPAAEPPVLPYFTLPDGTAVTESSRGNLFWRGRDHRWRTPPLDDEVLPGVTRRAVLDAAPALGLEVRVARGRVADLQQATGAFWTSSLSGVVGVTAIDGHPLPVPTRLLAALNGVLAG